VSKEDIKKNFMELYDFIMNYEYSEKAHEIKSTIYKKAIEFMKKEVKECEKKSEDD
jgi:hypothetical protein